jgi:hypothetical protein
METTNRIYIEAKKKIKEIVLSYEDKLSDGFYSFEVDDLVDEILSVFIPDPLPQSMLDKISAPNVGYGVNTEEYPIGMNAEEIKQYEEGKKS